jgi:methyl-accepting chemotaxis protein
MKRSINFKTKLMTSFLVLGLLPFVIVAFISLNSARNAIVDQVYASVKAVQILKKDALQEYFDTLVANMEIIAGTEDVMTLFQSLTKYHDATNVRGDGPYDVKTEKYRDIMLEHEKMVVHFGQANDLYDVFIICAAHGHVMYSTAKEADIGTNLAYGPHKDSNLASLWKKVKQSGETLMEDYRPYAPSGGVPAGFAGTPIHDRTGKLLGVFAIQLSMEKLAEIVSHRSGLGETEQSFLVGSDLRLRTDIEAGHEKYSVVASFKKDIKIDTVPVNTAIGGKEGQDVIVDYEGKRCLACWTPIDLPGGIRWAMINKLDEAEAFRDITELKGQIGVVGVTGALLIIAVALYVTRTINRPLTRSTTELRSAAEELNVSAQQQSTSLEEQTSSITEISTTMEELQQSAKQISEATANTATGADSANQAAHEGKDALELTNEGMLAIQNQVQKVTDNMLALGEKTHQMGLILEIINELTDQTTILSYNATIEAAGAGEKGNRFAAVADQIMGLAEKAKGSTKEIRLLIEDIQKSANTTVLISEDGMKSVVNGQALLGDTASHFDAIYRLSEENLVSARQVEMTVNQQTTSINQTFNAIKNVEESAVGSKASATQTQSTAQQLAEMAGRLAKL